MLSSLISIVVVLVIVGLILWAIQTFIPLDPKIKTLIQVVVILVLLLWILQWFGLFTGIDLSPRHR